MVIFGPGNCKGGGQRVSTPGCSRPAARSQRGIRLLLVVVRGRELLSLAFDQDLVLVFFPPDFGPLLLVLLGVADVGVERRGVGSRRDLFRVVVVDTGRHALLFRLVGPLVIVEAPRRAAQ